ncbi:hypothetical protein [Acidisphaera sp. S103]|uniref:hypothetical protein n=1 Tax=Acidisphaera sp. S103 TaxID=1747223 RepID=UPI00131BF877|nr:hypothetical protein [Acidisphaera sp. S103]
MPDDNSYDTTTTMDASAFIQTIGVNTHVNTGANGYGNTTNVLSDLSYLGIDNVRDGEDGSLATLETMAAAGIKFDFLLAGGGTYVPSVITGELSVIDEVEASTAGSVYAVEGANEINNFPITYNGVGGQTGAVDMQEAIYSYTKADTNLPGVNVFYFTGYSGDPDPSTTSGLADYDNQHPYSQLGAPPMDYVNRAAALTNESSSTDPAVYTETGYANNGGAYSGTFGTFLGQYGQAVYTLDLLFDDAVQGIQTTYLYELMEEGDGLGLFNGDSSTTPTMAATAIHNLTSILADSGTVAPMGVGYTVQNLPSDGNSMELLKSNGDSDIVVWAEPQVSEYATTPTTPVTVSLDQSYATVDVFDPMSGTSPIETLYNVSAVTLELTDHPLIIEVDPTASTTGTESSTDTALFAGSSSVLTDADGNTWGINTSNSDIVLNGTTDIYSLPITEMVYVNTLVWADTSEGWYDIYDNGGAAWVAWGPGNINPLPSASGTTINAGDTTDAITDASGNTWQISAGSAYQIVVDGGQDLHTGPITQMAYVDNTVWAESGGSWYSVESTPGEGDGQITVTSGPTTTPFESPNETVVVAGDTTDTVTDENGDVWGLNSADYLTLNGTIAGNTTQQALAYVDHTIWVAGGGNWYSLADEDGSVVLTGGSGETSPLGSDDDDAALVSHAAISAGLSLPTSVQSFAETTTPVPAATATPTATPTSLASILANNNVTHHAFGALGLSDVMTHGRSIREPTTFRGTFSQMGSDVHHSMVIDTPHSAVFSAHS